MTTNIQLLRSSVLNKRPAPASLLDGQAAVNLNTAAPGLFFKLSDGTSLTKIGPPEVNASGTAPNTSPTGSTGNSIGEMWSDGRAAFASPVTKIWTGSAWVPTGGFSVDDTTGNFSLPKTLTIRTGIVNGTGVDSYFTIPSGTTTQQNSITAQTGMLRFNSTLGQFTGYNGTTWVSFLAGGGGDTVFDNLTVNNNLTVGDTITTENLTVNGDTVLGNDCAADTLTITAVLTQTCVSNFINTANLWNRSEVRFSPTATPSGAATYVGFQAPATVAANVIWNLPDTDGTAGQLIRTDGAGNLGWASPSTFSFNQNLIPTADDAFDIGSPTARVRNLYTGDLHLTNERGSWTMIEEVDYLSLRNNKTGKTYKIAMEEV